MEKFDKMLIKWRKKTEQIHREGGKLYEYFCKELETENVIKIRCKNLPTKKYTFRYKNKENFESRLDKLAEMKNVRLQKKLLEVIERDMAQ